MNERNEFFSRMCGEDLTNREIVFVHGILLAFGIGAVSIETMPLLATVSLCIAGVLAWKLRR